MDARRHCGRCGTAKIVRGQLICCPNCDQDCVKAGGTRACPQGVEARKTQMRRIQRQEYREHGLCPHCGKDPGPLFKTCAACRKKRLAQKRADQERAQHV